MIAHTLERGGEEGEDRLFQNVLFSAEKERNLVTPKDALEHRLIPLQRPGGDGDIAEMPAPLPHQCENLLGGPFRLLIGAGGGEEAGAGRLLRGGRAVGEEVGLQMAQLRSHPGARFGQHLELHPDALLPAEGDEGLCGTPGGLKDRLPRLLQTVTDEGDGDAARLTQGARENLPLLRREVGEAVQIDIFALKPMTGAQNVRQAGEAVARVRGAPGDERLIAGQDQAEVVQPVALQSRLLPGGIEQILRADTVAL